MFAGAFERLEFERLRNEEEGIELPVVMRKDSDDENDIG